MALGPLMLDLAGKQLLAEERELLCHPLVGGVILFSRNYESPEQLEGLIRDIHALRSPRLVVAVDHEGGRVQRFRDGFTLLPPAGAFRPIYDHDRARAKRLAEEAGWLMAAELRAVGVDFSFAPVLDLDRGISTVIGDRAFHSDPAAVAALAGAYMAGMRRAGMVATGKHFPGHGAVAADSHEAIPVDGRTLDAILEQDVVPFARLIDNGLAGIMPAHVIYEQVDPQPAGFSPFWLRQVLRERLGFQGIIFSDDLNMEGASVAGGHGERAEAALSAGCDVALLCNNRPGALAAIDYLKLAPNPVLSTRLMRLHGKGNLSRERLHHMPEWHNARQALKKLQDDPSMELEFESR